MRLRLVHTLSLTLLAFAGLAVLALGGLTAWNLRNGFGNYLAARDVEHLERFAEVVAAAVAREGGLQVLQQGKLDMGALMGELDRAASLPGLPGRPPPREMRQPGPDPFPERVQVLGMDGSLLTGASLLAGSGDSGPIVERPVRLNDVVVAMVRMKPAPKLPEGGEMRFLHDQYRVIAASSAGLMLLALLTAALLARRWTRPLLAVQEATQRLARGELAVRLAAGPDLADRSDEIGDVVRNVNRMAEGLQRMEGARRRWLADISHELRTPLTVLRGDIEALQDGIRPLRQEAIAVLHEEVLRIAKLVDDLHLLATSDLQALPCHFAACDASALLHRLIRRFEGRACAAGLTLDLQLPDHLATLAVQWDADRIEQLLANLIENALHHTPGGTTITVAVGHADGHPTLAVTDTGPGIPAEERGNVLRRLYRLERSRTTPGSGLGLSLVAVIADLHDATLTLEDAGPGLRVQLAFG